MPSPFPGMDPYLEDADIWPDFHTMFLVALRTSITRVLPSRYSLVLERHVWIQESDDSGWRRVRPDVYIKDVQQPAPSEALQAALVAAPATVILPESHDDGPAFLKVIDRNSHRVVTVIELLSPANKNFGPDRESYLAKRMDYVARGLNLVEIDLLRSGERRPGIEQVPAGSDYYVLVSRATDRPRAGVWPFAVRDPLPSLSIPLLPVDKDVNVSLRSCLDDAYDSAQYNREIDYSQPPTHPLSEANATWARELLATTRLNH